MDFDSTFTGLYGLLHKHLTMILNLTIALVLGLFPNTNPLEKYMWNNRILLFYGDDYIADEYHNFTTFKDALDERDLLLIWTDGKNIETMPEDALCSEEIPQLIQNFKLDKYKNIILLIGKDGELKKKYNHAIPQYVFELIDAMPMRQNEINRKKDIILNQMER